MSGTKSEGMESVFGFLESICGTEPDLESGKRALIDYIRGAFPEYDPQVLESIDFEGLRSGFATWLSHLLKEEPIPDHIATTREDECDWMCITDTSYSQERGYAYVPEFKKLYDSL
jgi:hypothetical protein